MLRAMPHDAPCEPGARGRREAPSSSRPVSLASYFAAPMCALTEEFRQAVCWVRGIDDDTDIPWWKTGGEFRPGSRQPEAVKALMRDTVSYGSATLRETAEAIGADLERVSVLASVQPRGFLPGRDRAARRTSARVRP